MHLGQAPAGRGDAAYWHAHSDDAQDLAGQGHRDHAGRGGLKGKAGARAGKSGTPHRPPRAGEDFTSPLLRGEVGLPPSPASEIRAASARSPSQFAAMKDTQHDKPLAIEAVAKHILGVQDIKNQFAKFAAA